MTAAAPRVDQGPPTRISWRERLAHDQAESSVTGGAPGDLRREGQELLVDKALGVEVAEQPRPAFDQDSLSGRHAADLVEGGPRLLGNFYAEQLVDEQFLTLAPQVAGRDAGARRLSLVMGKVFAPGDPLWGTMIDARRGSSHLFLRYSFPESRSYR